LESKYDAEHNAAGLAVQEGNGVAEREQVSVERVVYSALAEQSKRPMNPSSNAVFQTA
jgi:hypothetical protein